MKRSDVLLGLFAQELFFRRFLGREVEHLCECLPGKYLREGNYRAAFRSIAVGRWCNVKQAVEPRSFVLRQSASGIDFAESGLPQLSVSPS